MNHKRLAAALLTALALTTLPAMGTAFAEDGVDAYGRPDAAARTQQENPPVTVSITPSLKTAFSTGISRAEHCWISACMRCLSFAGLCPQSRIRFSLR